MILFLNFSYLLIFDLLICSDLPQKPWCHGHNNRKSLKQPQSHFHWAIPHRSRHFSLFWSMLCAATPDISTWSKNINNTARVFRLSLRFLWLCWYFHYCCYCYCCCCHCSDWLWSCSIIQEAMLGFVSFL